MANLNNTKTAMPLAPKYTARYIKKKKREKNVDALRAEIKSELSVRLK